MTLHQSKLIKEHISFPPPPPLLLFNPTLIHPFSFFWDLALWVALSSWDVPLTTILGFHLSFSWLGFPVLCLTSSSFLACLLQMFHPTEKIAQWQRARWWHCDYVSIPVSCHSICEWRPPSLLGAQLPFWNLPSPASHRLPSPSSEFDLCFLQLTFPAFLV